ncbi:zinc finger mym-type protein 4-like isoform x1 [Gigaspora margarita]|uniref:Zinc finger mym-type protein 4-like isoform x1 n=1 Tax=Gigaspora margarita TaxID=4874 RepID=A0A8H4AMD9_GIGMA|nr:zinc finger mym-type protein 4-like isoform x1 [Gigaspora margarita]
MQKEKRKSYPVNLKLEAIEYAKKTNNHTAARLYNIDHTQISRWRVKEEEFKDARKTSHRVGSGASSLYPLAKNSLKEWIVERRLRGIAVTPNDVKFLDENKENEESIATTSIPYANTERSYLIREDETEIMDVLLY